MCNCKDCKGITLLKGSDGVGIVSITDNGNGTFTILLSNGNTFVSPNYQGDPGVGIDFIMWKSNSEGQPQGTPGTIDTYEINYTDSTTYDYTVSNGNNGADGQGVDHVSFVGTTNPGGTPGAAGCTDTYTVWGDVAETIDLGSFIVYNGADGEGAGCCPTITTINNSSPATITIPSAPSTNRIYINEYDLTSYSNFVLPSSATIGDTIEIIDNKQSFPSQTRITPAAGQAIFFSGIGYTTPTGRVELENSVNGSIKLMYVGSNYVGVNSWAIMTSNYYDATFGWYQPQIF